MTEREKFEMAAIHTLSTIALDNQDNKGLCRNVRIVILDILAGTIRENGFRRCIANSTNDDDIVALTAIRDGFDRI